MLKDVSCTGVILAGGESRRMGRQEKAFLRVGGRELLEWVLAALREVFSDIILVANRPELYQGFSVRIINDLKPGRGPLMGIYSALNHTDSEYIFVTACDMIFLQPRLIRFLLANAPEYDFILPGVEAQARYEPLHAVYSRHCLPVIEKLFQGEKNPRILDLFPRVRLKIVSPAEYLPHDPHGLAFVNINSPADLACAELFWRYYVAGEREL